jgi:hypothetical protein
VLRTSDRIKVAQNTKEAKVQHYRDVALHEQLQQDAREDRVIEEHTLVDDRAVEDEVMDFIFTFGSNHIWPLTGTSMFKSYVKLRGTFDGTRNEMFRRFGNRWSMQYLFDEANNPETGCIHRFELAEQRLEHLTEVPYR